MSTPREIESTERIARRSAPAGGGARVPGRPSFANALRQRGLLAKTTLPGSMAGAWSGAPGTWLAVSSVYEAHLRRALMEQALETLRGDAAA